MQHPELRKIVLEFINNTPFFIAILYVSIAIVFEGLFPQNKDQPVRPKLLNMANLLFVSLANCLVIVFLGKLFERGHLGLIDLRFANHTLLTSLLSVVMLIFITDVFYYWYHRTMHKVSPLWDIHAVHHSEMAFNVTMSVRRHWLEDPMQMALVALPTLFLFKLPPIDLPIVGLVYSFHVYFTHMNFRLQLGRYTGIITAPQLHRVHHSVLPEHIDTNFAQVFPVIDMMFGTYVPPKRGEFPPTGLSTGEPVDTVGKLLFWPFMQWKVKWKSRKAKRG